MVLFGKRTIGRMDVAYSAYDRMFAEQAYAVCHERSFDVNR